MLSREKALKILVKQIKSQYNKYGKLQPEVIRNILAQYKNNKAIQAEVETLFVYFFSKYGTNFVNN